VKLDPDEIEMWKRNPVTQELLRVVKTEDPLYRFRAANDMLSLGRAQGYDMALQAIGRALKDPQILVSK
jgi:hypothetical protein